MAQTADSKGFFWDSIGGDRKYNSNSFAKWLSKFFTTGVFTGDLEVTAKPNSMAVLVAPGYANINNPLSDNPGGRVLLTEDTIELPIEMADANNARIDTVVVERNDNDREINIKIVKGEASVTPVATPPVRTSAVYQLVVAEILVEAAVSQITDDKITMKRADQNVCGIITGTVWNNQILYGTEVLTPGVSELADGTVYFVYE